MHHLAMRQVPAVSQKRACLEVIWMIWRRQSARGPTARVDKWLVVCMWSVHCLLGVGTCEQCLTRANSALLYGLLC